MNSKRSPEEILRADGLKTYRRERDAICSELVRLNTELLYMRRLADFPFGIFGGTEYGFWDIAYVSFFESVVGALYRVGYDESSGSLTLRKSSDSVYTMIQCEDQRVELREQVDGADYIVAYGKSRDCLKHLRDERVAHFSRTFVAQGHVNIPDSHRVSLEQLEEIRDSVNEFFRLLCLGHEFGMILRQYVPTCTILGEEESDESDISLLLDHVAKSSGVLNMPEDQPDFWPIYREENLTEDDIVVFNAWRSKFDLPLVE